MTHDLSRRQFMSAAGGALGLAVLPQDETSSASDAPDRGAVILFQGDSITDVGRNRGVAEPNRGNALGAGYPLLLASELLRAYPDRGLSILNRGISGNRVPDLQARWETDALALKPSVLSILIGVNDIWHKLNGRYDGSVQEYERGYLALLQSTRAALPDTQLVVMEPFVLRVGAVNERWFPEFDERREAAARVARQVGARFVPLQDMFDKLAARSTPGYWLPDGVHPSLAGHAAIAERWRKLVRL